MPPDGRKFRGEGTGERKLSRLSRRLLVEWKARGWPMEDVRVVVAVSGGADSVALLLALDELGRARHINLGLTVAHLNHGLRGERADADARWVKALAESLEIEAVVRRADVGRRARVRKDNVEQAARRARYEFLERVACERGAWAVLTAHTLDDQAETVLLRLLRGSGAEGLTGMRPERVLAEDCETKLVRPLVAWARRADTVAYCRERGVEFRSDEMNEDESFARVRVRRKLLPLLETFNPRAVEAIARAAELLADDAAALDEEAARLLDEAARTSSKSGRGTEKKDESVRDSTSKAPPLSVDVLVAAPAAVRRRALRRWIEAGRGDLRRVEMAHMLAVEKLLRGERGGRVAELPGGSFVERRRGLLRFSEKSQGRKSS